MIIRSLSEKQIAHALIDIAKKKGVYPVLTPRNVTIKDINTCLKSFGNYSIKKLSVKDINAVLLRIERELP